MIGKRLFFGVSHGGRQPYCFAGSVLKAQVKAIASVVRGLLEEALKVHIGAPQLENIRGPPFMYLQNKR